MQPPCSRTEFPACIERTLADTCFHGSGHVAGGLYFRDGTYTSLGSIAFVDNFAAGLGGAVFIQRADIVQVNDTVFVSNVAALGGALFVTAVEDKQAIFSECVFNRNRAADGGAAYLNTGPALDIFTESVFHNNSASEFVRLSRPDILVYVLWSYASASSKSYGA